MGVKWKEEDSLALEQVLFEELELNKLLSIDKQYAFFKDFVKYLQHNRSEEIKGRTSESLRNNIRDFKTFCFELGFTLMDVIHILRMSPSILNVSIESLRDKYTLMGLIDDHSYHLRKTKLILNPDDYRVSNELIYARYMLMKTLDYPNMINKLIKLISPEYVMITEIEIWPSMIYCLHKKLIPLYMINGRIGKKEIKGYKNFQFFFKPYFNMYRKILAQSQIDKKNMIKIGMPESLITVTGNLKYDINYSVNEEKIDDLESRIPANKFVITVGSSHHNEEEIILKAINSLGIKENIFIVIVPRDINRGNC